MPLLRYFVFVGGALLVLLLIVAAASPPVPTAGPIVTGGDVPSVRILSDRKWPERIVLDTTQPTIAPPVVALAAVAPKSAPTEPTDVAATVHAGESLAQLVPQDAKNAVATKKPHPPKRKVARARPPGWPMIIVAQQPRYGFGWW